MNRNRTKYIIVVSALFFGGCQSPQQVYHHDDHIWSLSATPLNRSAAQLSNDTSEHLAWAKAYRTRILEAKGPRNIINTLVPYNMMMMHIDAAASESSLFAQVHPDKSIRDVAENSEQEVKKYVTDLSLDRGLFEAFNAINIEQSNEATKFLVYKIRRDFRRAGVHKSQEDRKKIAALNEEIVKIRQTFGNNIRNNDREIILNSIDELDGLPQDWIDKHQPADDGTIHISTRYPDYYPFMTYAKNAEARKNLYTQFKNRGYPKNMDVLQQLLQKRYELARILGYRNWADYITEDKMIRSAANARSFIDRISEICKTAAERDYDVLLNRKQQDHPDAVKVEDWEKGYYEKIVKAEKYAFDPQAVRPYFNFEDVQRGLFELTGRLFGITYKPVGGLKLWHDDVSAWDVYDKNKLLGRFYLDLHPRENKYGHAAQFDYRTGIANLRIPQATLVCNFPNPRDSKEGIALMEHSEVVTFFHEFGHLLHAIFSGHRMWIGNSGITTEWDFVEAPSQMLEEWCFDRDSLRIFAKHYRTGEPIPNELVNKLRQARDFGKGLYVAHQMFYASISLNYYDADPTRLDTTKKMIALQKKFSPFDYVDDTHIQCNFGHLDGYSAIYYTYMWSLVIAKDMFSQFEKSGILNTRTAKRYREAILEPGGSKKATQLIKDFLARPYSFKSFENWMNR